MEWNRVVFGNSLSHWSQSIALSIALFLALWISKKLLSSYLDRVAQSRHNPIYETLSQLTQRTKLLFLLALSVGIAIRPLNIPAGIERSFDRILIVALVLQLGLWGGAFLRLWLEPYLTRKLGLASAGQDSKVAVVSFLLQVVFFALLGIWGLDNLGINVSALVAGLGVGGIAVALATQNILGDLFASLSITLDKPFQIGDTVRVDALEGTIEKIGLKTTRVRSINGEQLVFSNADLLASRISNLRRMEHRRVLIRIGVVYETPSDKLEKIPELITQAVGASDIVKFERVHFVAFGPSSLDYEFVYWIKEGQARTHLMEQERILMEILHKFRTEKIDFAYPTQTLFLNTTSATANGAKLG